MRGKLSEYLDIGEIQLFRTASRYRKKEFEPILLGAVLSKASQMLKSVNVEILDLETRQTDRISLFAIHMLDSVCSQRSIQDLEASSINHKVKYYLEKSINYLQNLDNTGEAQAMIASWRQQPNKYLQELSIEEKIRKIKVGKNEIMAKTHDNQALFDRIPELRTFLEALDLASQAYKKLKFVRYIMDLVKSRLDWASSFSESLPACDSAACTTDPIPTYVNELSEPALWLLTFQIGPNKKINCPLDFEQSNRLSKILAANKYLRLNDEVLDFLKGISEEKYSLPVDHFTSIETVNSYMPEYKRLLIKT